MSKETWKPKWIPAIWPPNDTDGEDVLVVYADDGSIDVGYYDSMRGWSGSRPVAFWHPLPEGPFE